MLSLTKQASKQAKQPRRPKGAPTSGVIAARRCDETTEQPPWQPTTPVYSWPKGSQGSVRLFNQADAVDNPEGVGARETASNTNLFTGRGGVWEDFDFLLA